MNNKQRIVSQFGQNAHKYVTSTIHAKGKDLPLLVEVVKENRHERLLDIATGGGHVVHTLAPFFNEAVALDLTKDMLKNAEAFIQENGHENVSFVEGDAENLPFADASFDTVTCRIAPHHFPHVDRFVHEAYRVVEKNGLFLLIDNVAPEREELDEFYNIVEKRRDSSHFRACKKTEWISMIERTGFRVESIVTFTKTFPFEWWCSMTNLPEDEKNALNEYMLSAPEAIRSYFQVEIEDGSVQSFDAGAMFLVARK
ncbi:class I SAM-dependent methyltransferase [Priestia taiwanensis]|uniref:SAM-dependent methyltransferase n=1 Tax=Priestia taiwanensis TaxID=1347902 RepID=A0A917ENQ1_9BACI|nr:class I SAM-dependent methyltransferase [Priestia taiwanensis]MBM7363128.1 ubiquinone/menaquinone biosynthesis C-methylase UbiE [Priestia taiwanensis]GGE67915.1 SAM-dependent methyltransferase [Priestia taiwanensis]